jgi:SAM-dependent methyltransferase
VGATERDPDPKRIVADGYDRVAERYSEWTGIDLRGPRAQYLDVVMERVLAGTSILELGCATGVPVSRYLASRYHVTGVDISPRQIQLARLNVPVADFIEADMTAIDFPTASFDAALAFYAITHVPREEHPALLTNIARWLRPGGLLIASFGCGDDSGTIEEDWLGAPMYFSSYDATTNERLVREAGFNIVSADRRTEDENGVPVTFLWIVAQKPID